MPTCHDCRAELESRRRARGCCLTCYSRRLHRGTHLDVPTRSHKRADVVDDYLMLRDQEGLTREQIAPRLGMTRDALDQALRRAAQAGDQRIDYRPKAMTGVAA